MPDDDRLFDPDERAKVLASADQKHAVTRDLIERLVKTVATEPNDVPHWMGTALTICDGDLTRFQPSMCLAWAVYRLGDVQVALNEAMRVLGLTDPDVIDKVAGVVARWSDD